MNVLISGGRGLIGQAIAKEHIKWGDTVYLYDTRINPFLDYTLPFLGEDITHEGLESFLKRTPVDLISYQGALVGVGESQYAPYKYTLHNVTSLAEFQQSLVRLEVHAPIFHAGSMAPYGEGSYFCQHCDSMVYPREREDIVVLCPRCGEKLDKPAKMHSFEIDELRPVSTYAITKQTQEEMWRNYSKIHKVPVMSLRYFSVYGMEQSPLNPRTGVLNMIANQILNNKSIILNEDGEQTRDMVNAIDIGRIHAELSRKQIDGFSILNICTGKSHSLNDIAMRMKHAMNSSHTIVHTGKYRVGDVRHVSGTNHSLSRYNLSLDSSLLLDIEAYGDWVVKNKSKFIANTWKEEQERCHKGGIQ
jgi:nucleoside-diphosphate-sugar epimerase